MEALLFMLGSLAFLGLLVACAMRVFTASDREEEARRLESQKQERRRKAA